MTERISGRVCSGKADSQLHANDRNQGIDRDGDPDLRLDGILGRAEEALDLPMALDSANEEFGLPATLIQSAHRDCGEIGAVGEEDEQLAGLGVAVADTPQVQRTGLLGAWPVQCNGLSGQDAAFAVLGSGVDTMVVEVLLRSGDEGRSGLMQGVETFELKVGRSMTKMPLGSGTSRSSTLRSSSLPSET